MSELQDAPSADERTQQMFVPNQVVLWFDAHDQNYEFSEEQVRKWINAYLLDYLGAYEIHLPQAAQLADESAPAGSEIYEKAEPKSSPFPVFSGNSENGIPRSSAVVVTLTTSNGENSTARLAEIVIAINKALPQLQDDNIALRAASPNWLYGASTHGFADAGPGGRPIPVKKQHKKKYKFKPEKIKEIDEIIKDCRARGNPKNSVNVVIFDTAPIKEWRKSDVYEPKGGNFWSGLNDKLEVYYASKTGVMLPLSPSKSVDEHYELKDSYKMTDHGIFIAGLVHSWAPDANIHLVEVMNDYGVSSLQGLIQAFEWLYNKSDLAPDVPLVVNCSLCLCAALPPHRTPGNNDPRAQELHHLLLSFSEYRYSDTREEVQHPLVMLPLDRAMKRGKHVGHFKQMRVIAAAGNDGLPNEPSAPAARYPAAYDCIVGVGAVEEQMVRAWYSNKADAPPTVGIMVTGGKAKNNSGKNITEPELGLMGIYLDAFPPGTPDLDDRVEGWAWWSGTSFATGIVSGIFARAADQGCDISCKGEDKDDFINMLIAGKDDQTHPDKEPVLNTPQVE